MPVAALGMFSRRVHTGRIRVGATHLAAGGSLATERPRARQVKRSYGTANGR